MRVFLDSSAIVKRYINEPGSEKLNELCAAASSVILSIITSVEVSSAFSRSKREKKITSSQLKLLKLEFSKDLNAAEIVELYPRVISQSKQCLERTALRSLDAIQLASAIVAEVDLFITSDERQIKAAKAFKVKSVLI